MAKARDIIIIVVCYAVSAMCGWLLGKEVAGPAIRRMFTE